MRKRSGGDDRGLYSLALLLGGTATVMLAIGMAGEGPFSGLPDDQSLQFRIDINRAARRDIEALPGIGEVLTERILKYRAEHGMFSSAGDLEKVQGIGPAAVARIRAYIVAGGRGGSVGSIDDEFGGGDESGIDGR